MFKLEKRKMIFQGGNLRSLILKNGISNGILEVFVLVTLTFEVFYLFLFFIKED
jgi:hypothetical protein